MVRGRGGVGTDREGSIVVTELVFTTVYLFLVTLVTAVIVAIASGNNGGGRRSGMRRGTIDRDRASDTNSDNARVNTVCLPRRAARKARGACIAAADDMGVERGPSGGTGVVAIVKRSIGLRFMSRSGN